MPTFIADNLISGKLTWAKVLSSKTYSKYTYEVLEVLHQKGYTIDADGKCVPIDDD